jgi:hypothetical protein
MKSEAGPPKLPKLDSNNSLDLYIIMKTSFSRAAVDLFCECPRCFYLQHKFGLKRPPGFPFTLNAAVDRLTKAEFDHYRDMQTSHPLMKSLGLNLIPLKHSKMNDWRNSRRGVRAHFQGYEFFGVVDDVWNTQDGKSWHVVDYKATAKKDPVTELDETADHHQSYQRQVSFYTWLLAQNGFPVSDLTYFVYSPGDNQVGAFNDQLVFRTCLIEHRCNTSWIEPTLSALIQCLESEELPNSSEKCTHCDYIEKSNHLISTLTHDIAC